MFLGAFSLQFFRFPALLFEDFSLVLEPFVVFLEKMFAGVAVWLGRGVVVVSTAVLSQQVFCSSSQQSCMSRRRTSCER